MKSLFENWRGFLNEITTVPIAIKDILRQAVVNSKFWEEPNTVDDIDLRDDPEHQLGTPATERLQDSLNQTMKERGLELWFDVSSGKEEYVLGPGDPYGKSLNNWMMRGNIGALTRSMMVNTLHG